MDYTLAHQKLAGVLAVINQWGALYDVRWGHNPPYVVQPNLHQQVKEGIDSVRTRTKLAQGIIAAMGERDLAAQVVEESESHNHPFTQARIAIIEAIAIISQREELAEVVGQVGPQLSASDLNPVIWGAAAGLWDDGHFRAAVQTAATALEGVLQGIAGPGVAGEGLGLLFSVTDPTSESARLRIRDVDPASKTWRSVHEGAGAMVRGAFMAVRNLVSHPGWPEPTYAEALEMISILSYIANLAAKADVVRVQ